MEILTPLHQPQPTVDRLSGAELTQQPSRAELSASPSLTEIAEEDENEGERREKVYLAVGRNVDKAFSLIRWTVRSFKSSDVCFVHVHQPSPLIPTLLGKMPASRASPEVVTAFRNEEQEKMKKLLHYYVNICLKAKVKASFIITEAEQVRVGLMELVNNHHIKKLVMGSVSTNPGKVTKRPSKANYAAKNAPTFCAIWFIYKGNHVWTRESCEEATFSSTCQEELITGSLRSKSFQYDRSECLYSSDHLRFNSLRLSMGHSDVNDCVQNECSDEDLLLPHTLSRSLDSCGPSFNRSSTSNDSSFSMSAEISSSGSDAKLDEESLYSELLELNTELEKSKNDMLVELLKREKLEAEAIQAIQKVKDIRFIHSRENELRKEAEDALRNMLHEQERLLEERLEVTGELQKTMRSVAVLDSRVQEANRRCDEAAMELKLVQVCIVNLHHEKQMIQRQKIEADRWLQKRRSCRHNGGPNRQGCGGLLDDVPELIEFSLLDLQTATCNFSESFKLGERGYCSVYKGELLGRTVAIQRLHGHMIQGPSQFQKEVQLLNKLRHPHLVNLIGACSEEWSLVCDYVPNTLQCCLFQKSKNVPLSWKIRARIISEISTALLFLHSSYPEKIVHGDIIPVNILLDSDLHVKICDFGISKLLMQDTLCGPSLGRCNEPKGAFPYTDPELHRTGKLTPKSDVYSFGMVILQLLTGQPPVGLVSNVRKAVSSGKLALLLDPCAGIWGPFVAEKLADMALRFCEPNSRDRPELTPSLVKELQQLHISQEQPVPSFFLCPIQQEIMCDPQVAADGFTYEGEAIREWLENGRETSPMTNLRLDHLHLTPNHSLRLAIQEWLCKY